MLATSSGELQTLPSASLDDLNLELFRAHLKRHIPRLAADETTDEEALLRLRLAGTMGTRFVPTMGGLYLFGQTPQWLAPQLGVVCACFDGNEITAEISQRDHLDGNLGTLIEGAKLFINNHARKVVNQVDPRVSASEFHPEVVHEALVNALVHRDLRTTGQVALRLFRDRLEIFSPGAPPLPDDINIHTRVGGVSLPRNPVVAAFARQMGFVEQLGRGLPMMRRLVEDEVHGSLGIQAGKEGVLVVIPSSLALHAQKPLEFAN